MTYFKRLIDDALLSWKAAEKRKPLLLRGARQVGKSSAVRELGRHFKYFAEVNLEKSPSLVKLFLGDVDVKRLCSNMAAALEIPIVAGETLLFIDEIQVSREAMRSLRYFKEDFPELHVVAAGSLLEFTLGELASFAVGRVSSLYMYPFSFDEFLEALGMAGKLELKKAANASEPLPEAIHKMLVEELRAFFLIGGMPAAVSEWADSRDYAECAKIHNEILDTYQDDFSKYRGRILPTLLGQVLRSIALQAGKKFVFNQAAGVRSQVVNDVLRLLALAGLAVPAVHSDASGVPLVAEENLGYVKYLPLDTGLMLSMLSVPAAEILLSNETELVNKGAVAEVFTGLELMKYGDSSSRVRLHYWQNNTKNSNAEVDYLAVSEGKILPIEVKSSTRGSMQSLYLFMRKKHLENAVRTSLEPFGSFERLDSEDAGAIRKIHVVPLYALSNLKVGF